MPEDAGTNERIAVMDKEQALNLVRQFKQELIGKLPVKNIYLYGSYSKGTNHADSDIDVAVIVDKLADNYFDDTPILWRARRKISTLIEPVLLTADMDNPLYYDIQKTGMLV